MQDRGLRIIKIVIWTATIVAIASVAAAIGSGFGHSAGLWHYRFGFTLLRWSSYITAGAGTVALLGGVLAVIGRLRGHALAGFFSAALALALVVPAWELQQTAKEVPRIHDITTDTEHPPRFVALLPVRQTTANGPEYGGEEIAREQKAAYPEIAPALLKEPPARAFEQALAAARSLGWEIVAAVPAEGRIEATDTTRWFRFKDDVVIRVTPNGAGSRIDVRSKSRVGRGDVGTNAKRISAYLRALRKV